MRSITRFSEISDSNFIDAVKSNQCIRDVVGALGYSRASGSMAIKVKERINKLNIDTSHFIGRKSKPPSPPRYSMEEILVENSKASQFNHFNGTYTKKTLSQRWNDFNGIKVQRDLYSAFLIMNISDDLKSFDIDKCNERFENFYRLYNLEVNRLAGKKNLNSIAI